MTIEPSVSLPGEVVRRVTPAKVACRLGCGGKKCKHEQHNFDPINQKSIFSCISASWVLRDEIVAMARPSEVYMETLIGELKRANVKSLVNVQELGEHELCGDILKSGFTYLPETVMRAGICFYNFPTADFGIWENRMLLQIAKVLDGALSDGAIAIHCHAGLGRTGVICAASLIYSTGLTGTEASKNVRENRPGSLQTRGQIAAVEEFEVYFHQMRRWPTNEDSILSLYALQRPTTLKRTKERKDADIMVPHFIDYVYQVVMNNDYNQPNKFELEEWLISTRIKKGMWPHIKLLSGGDIAKLLLEWCFALGTPLIDGGGCTNYVELLTTPSSIVSARLVAETLIKLRVCLPDICGALTHRQPGVDCTKLVSFLRDVKIQPKVTS